MLKLTDLIPAKENKILNKLAVIKNYGKFFSELSKMAKKDDNLLSFIKSWKYYNKSKLLSISSVWLDAKTLQPTQKELDLNKTLETSLTDVEQLHTLLQKRIVLGIPIITFQGKYIIDGHHRWSQVMAFNPEGQMLCLNIVCEENIDVKDILKIIQLAIYGEKGSLEMKTIKSKNIYTQSATTIKKYVNKTITDACKIYLESQVETNADTFISKNITKIKSKNKPISGAITRHEMPQLDGNNQILSNFVNSDNMFSSIPKTYPKIK